MILSRNEFKSHFKSSLRNPAKNSPGAVRKRSAYFLCHFYACFNFCRDPPPRSDDPLKDPLSCRDELEARRRCHSCRTSPRRRFRVYEYMYSIYYYAQPSPPSLSASNYSQYGGVVEAGISCYIGKPLSHSQYCLESSYYC